MADVLRLTIDRIGARGDGVAETPSGPMFIPFTLPGEVVDVACDGERGTLSAIITPSTERIAPVCRHFGTCGGCALQHMERASYLSWKEEQVRTAFRARGIDAPAGPVKTVNGYRRRATFTARLSKSGVVLGFHQAMSHDLIDIDMCAVIDPSIVAALPRLRTLLRSLIMRDDETRVHVLASDGGLDVSADTFGIRLSAAERAELVRHGAAVGVLRLTVDGDTILEAERPLVGFGKGGIKARVCPPPASFLQAVAEAERVMAEITVAAIGKAKRVADLFCGLGAFTFPLAEKYAVLAVDSDEKAIVALSAGARAAQGLKPIETRIRDLFREPMSGTELRGFDAVVFDPPRAGAEAQVRMIAKSKVPVVVGVSCNPATLARDARILIDAGYALTAVTPVDQFVYSPHIEAVAVFRR